MLAVALWFAAGVVLSRGWKGAAAIGGVLHKWVLWAALPALVLAKVPTMRLDSDAAVPVIAAWLCVGAGAAAVLIVARTSRWPGEVTGVMLLLVPLGNTSFLGLPVVSSLLGEDHLPAALAFDQLGTFLALATYGTWVAARYGNGDGRPADVALRIATFPPFVALAASFLLRQWPLTDVAHDALRTVGSTVAPAAMLATGLRLRVTRLEGRACLVTTGLALKMVLLPVLVVVLALVAGDIGSVAWRSAVAEAAMPPMVTAGIVAAGAGLDEELATGLVAAGTVVGLLAAVLVSFVG
ncbi:MAG: hypothetical protein RLZZ305_809 [Actinomycetota bacterium]